MEHFVITIGRQFGSGGRELGRELSERLGVKFYDKELLMQAAKEAGIDPGFFIDSDERMPKFFNGLIPFNMGLNPMGWYSGTSSISDDQIYRAQSDFIRSLAQKDSCILVGRSADYVLRDMPHVLNVFVHADPEDCVDRILARAESTDRQKARRLAEKMNRLRSSYYNFYTDKRWGHASSYDLCFNSSRLSIPQIADIIVQALKAREPHAQAPQQ